jgi:hypothetical protein
MAKKDYQSEALRLSKAIDIAINAVKTHPPKGFGQTNIDQVLSSYEHFRQMTLNPQPQFRKIASLKYLVEEVFTYFQESTGDAVEYFWTEIDKEKLGYIREDKLRKILDRGKIRGRIEFDYAIDILLVAKQTGRITFDEAGKLSDYIGDYEFKSKKKIIQ